MFPSFFSIQKVFACECDARTRECKDPPSALSQNSPVTLCVSTNSTEVVIGDIKSLELSQGSLAYNAITNSTPLDSFTSKSEMGTQREVVSTRLVSAFFLDPTTAVTVSGTAIMEFVGVGRKLVNFVSRALEEDDAEAEAYAAESKFAVQVLLNDDAAESSVAPMDKFAASAAWAVFVTSLLIALSV